jgi:hypothetical protein
MDEMVRETPVPVGRRRSWWWGAGGGALVIAAAVAVVGLPHGDHARPAVSAGCADRLTPALLPGWARAGFSDPEPRAPFVTSSSGQLVAILFTDGLYAPPKPDQSNKILWVTPTPGGPLRISARLDGTTSTVARAVEGGPGPSIVDLPGAGCWHLTLSWGAATDTIDLRYSRP